MTNPMIERVAKAIENALNAGYVAAIIPTVDDDGEPITSTFRFDGEITPADIARAAIEAMREPTEAMEDVASNADSDNWRALSVWEGLIDAALKEE